MKNVIVLTNNEPKKFDFLVNLGYDNIYQPPTMCMKLTPTKIFNYQMFNLSNNDIKLMNYLKSRDGVIIVVDTIDDQIIKQCTNVINQNTHHPVLIVLENSNNQTYNLNHIIKNQLLHKYVQIKRYEIAEKDDTNDKVPYNVEIKYWFNDALKKSERMQLGNDTSKKIDIVLMAKEFESCTLPLELWDHYGRLKIVYYAIRNYGFNNTIDKNGWLCTNWIKYKTSIGHGNLWHYSLTRFWAHVINKLISHYNNFDDLYMNNPQIQNGQYFKKFYSEELLFTPFARSNWFPPNLTYL